MNCCCSAKTKRKFFRKPRNAGGHYFLYFFCSCPGTSIQSFFQPARWLCTISVIRQAKEREVVHKHYVSLQVRHIPVTGRHLNVAHFEDQLRLPNADPDTMPLGDLLVLSRGAAQRPSFRWCGEGGRRNRVRYIRMMWLAGTLDTRRRRRIMGVPFK